jgi:hypothetical protein
MMPFWKGKFGELPAVLMDESEMQGVHADRHLRPTSGFFRDCSQAEK